MNPAGVGEPGVGEIVLQVAALPAVEFDEIGPGSAAAERLDAEAAGAGEEVENAAVGNLR